MRRACVEAVEDDRIALCTETAKRFGMEPVAVCAGKGSLPVALEQADLV